MDEAVASRCRPPPVSLVVVVLVVFGLLPAGSVGATSQGPVADGPYVGTLPCADCAGIRTTLTLHSMGEGGLPIAYRMTRTWLGTPAGERSEEQLGPWMRLRQDDGELIRIEPYSDARRQSFRRLGPDELVLLDRGEQLIVTSHALGLKRDMHAEPPRLTPPRTLFRGVLVRESGALLFAPCGGGKPLRFRDASPEAVITRPSRTQGSTARRAFTWRAGAACTRASSGSIVSTGVAPGWTVPKRVQVFGQRAMVRAGASFRIAPASASCSRKARSCAPRRYRCRGAGGEGERSVRRPC